MVVGGGSSGGCGINTSSSSGGGAGGQSGVQSCLFIPSIFLPNTLYVLPGFGGKQPTALVSGALGVAGQSSYVSIEPWTTTAPPNDLVLFASGGNATGAAPTSSAGGTPGTAAGSAPISPLGARGLYLSYTGAVGSSGQTASLSSSPVGLPATGLMVSGGTGGGASATIGTGGNGVSITTINTLGGGFWPVPAGAAQLIGGAGASGSTPAKPGSSGYILPYYIMNLGGFGGGGATTTSGGIAGNGGDGAPGCGGGGAGGSNTTNTTLARPGNGGDGFIVIMSF